MSEVKVNNFAVGFANVNATRFGERERAFYEGDLMISFIL